VDEKLRSLYREFAAGQISREEFIPILYRAGQTDEADEMLIFIDNELRQEGKEIQTRIVNISYPQISSDTRRKQQMGNPDFPLFQEWYEWIGKLLAFIEAFPPRCSCLTCSQQCICALTGRNCNYTFPLLGDVQGCQQCETLFPHLGSNCKTPNIDPGHFAIELGLKTINKGQQAEFIIPELICRDMHWVPGGTDEDGMATGGFDDVEYFHLWPGWYVPYNDQSPAEIIRWVLKHATCRIPPEEDYDWSSPEEQWRAAIEEEQEGFGRIF